MNASILLGEASLPEMSDKRRKETSETSNKFTLLSEIRKIISYYTLNVIEVHHARKGYELQGFKGQKEQGHAHTDIPQTC